MFCDGCGTQIQAGQNFCSKCGKPAPQTIVTPALSRVSRHIHILGILWLVLAAFTLIGAVVLFILSVTLFGPASPIPPSPEVPAAFLHMLFSFLSVFLLIKAAACLAVGVGLLQRQPWARPLALVMGFIALLSVPFGTALGVYTLFVLMSPTSAAEYQQLSATE
jgi:hypothetical protein